MKKVLTLFSLLLIAAAHTWASMPAIAKITVGENTTDYYNADDFVSAFLNLDGEASVTLLDDVTLPDEIMLANVSRNADITLHLNGNGIKGSCSSTVMILAATNSL